jgi:hypothetical protein
MGRATGKPGRRPDVSPSAAEIKAWARSNGYEVADRGRVSKAIQDAYAAAH